LLRGRGQADAADTLLRGWNDLVTYYDLPAEHWRHLWTGNVGESVFGVRLRTDITGARFQDGLLTEHPVRQAMEVPMAA
jgi:hypothetical protein